MAILQVVISDERNEPEERIVCLEGEIDADSANGIADVLCETVNCHIIVVNLDRVTFMDSSGIAQIVIANRELIDEGKRLVIVGANAIIQKAFEICGLEEMLTE